jgi:hypothetical protein
MPKNPGTGQIYLKDSQPSFCLGFCIFAVQWSISPIFYERICPNILALTNVQTKILSTNKPRAKLSMEKAGHKMLVKLTPRTVTKILVVFFRFSTLLT